MTKNAHKKPGIPTFIGIYSKNMSGMSKSFSGGAFVPSTSGQQGHSPNALVPPRSKDASPFSKGMAPMTEAYSGSLASEASAVSPHSGLSEQGVRWPNQRPSASDAIVSGAEMHPPLSPSGSLPADISAASSRPRGAPLVSRLTFHSHPHPAVAAPGDSPAAPAATACPKADAAAAHSRRSLGGGGAAGTWARAAQVGPPAQKTFLTGLLAGAGSGVKRLSGSEAGDEEEGQGRAGSVAGGEELEDGAAAEGDGRAGAEEGDLPKSKSVADMLKLVRKARTSSGEVDLPRLGVRFPGQQQQAAASPLKQRASEAVSRSSSFSAGIAPSVLSSRSFTAGKAPGPSNLYRVKWLDFGYTPEQALAKAAAERVARTALAKHAAKADESCSFPREAIAAAAKEGFGGFAVPASYGGMGLNANDSALLFEALGMGDTSIAGYLTIHNMVAWLVANHGTPAVQQQVLRNLASTAVLAAHAATEPASGSDPAAVTSSATPGAGGYTLNGTKAFVAGAAVADVFLVLARTGEQPTKGLSLFLVNKTIPGLSVGRPEKSLGWRSVSLATLSLQNVAVRSDALIGREGQGLDLLNAALDLQRVWLSAVSVGGAQFALDYAISLGKQLKQGTKALTDLQAVQFRMVDLHAELQAARLMVRSSAQQLDAKAPTRAMSAAMAKQFATETAASVAAEVCSLMGGAGMVGDHPTERIARDLRTHTVVGGANDQLLGKVYGEMQRLGPL